MRVRKGNANFFSFARTRISICRQQNERKRRIGERESEAESNGRSDASAAGATGVIVASLPLPHSVSLCHGMTHADSECMCVNACSRANAC